MLNSTGCLPVISKGLFLQCLLMQVALVYKGTPIDINVTIRVRLAGLVPLVDG